jgi:transcriptional regulator with XRE-family HTH domain
MKRKDAPTKDLKSLFRPAKSSADLIKAFRKNFEITQDYMAFACGISQANLAAIESGRRTLGPKVALRIAAFLGINPIFLLYPGGYENEPEFKAVINRQALLKGK